MRTYRPKEITSKYSIEKRNLKYYKPFYEFCKEQNIRVFVKDNVLLKKYQGTKFVDDTLYTTCGLFTLIVQDLLKEGNAEIVKKIK